MVRQEIPNNTPGQIREYLSAALELVGALELPDDLRVAAFEQAVQLFAGKQIVMGQPQAVDLAGLTREFRNGPL